MPAQCCNVPLLTRWLCVVALQGACAVLTYATLTLRDSEVRFNEVARNGAVVSGFYSTVNLVGGQVGKLLFEPLAPLLAC